MTYVTAPIFAFGFASPWLLGGLALGGIPIIVHLLHKRRYREMPWAAMRFLIEATRKHSRRIRLEQLVLMVVRTLILVLLVLALARPFVESFGTYFQAEVPTHRIIVVDASFSLGYQPAQFSRFDRAKDIARKIVSSAKRGDALNLLRVAGSEPRAIILQPAFQKGPVLEEIEQLKLTDERGDVFATLKQVLQLLKEAPEISQKEITLISDFQAENWSPPSSGRKAQIRKLLKQLSDQANLLVLDLGQLGTQNAAITDFSADQPFVAVGQPVRLNVSVQNFGVTPLRGQLLELYVDGQLAQTHRIDLVPGTSVPAEFTHTFSSAGEYRLEARLEDDALNIDNHRWLTLPAKSELSVLLVNGKHSGRVEEQATYHVQLALSPSTSDKPWQGIMRPHVINEGELPGVDLSRYDCVILCNVALLTKREADLLHIYVESGGGLVIGLGDQIQADNYNQRLYRDGKGLLPAKLGQRRGDAKTNSDTVFYFDAGDFEHPILSEFRKFRGRGLESTMTFEYVQAVLSDDSPARIALRFDSGDPVIVDKTLGQGRSILFTTSLDGLWGTWTAFSTSFVAMIHESVLHSVSGGWSDRQLAVGDPLTRTFSTRVFDMPVTLKLPDESERPIRLTERIDFSTVSYETTSRNGVYELTLGQPLNRKELFAVNVDPRESDLSKLDAKEIKSGLLPEAEFIYRTQWQDVKRETKVAVVERGGLTRWLLLATLCLVFVEQMMAWNFWYGFQALYAVVAMGFVRQTMAWNAAWGLVLLAVFIAGIFAMTSYHRSQSHAG